MVYVKSALQAKCIFPSMGLSPAPVTQGRNKLTRNALLYALLTVFPAQIPSPAIVVHKVTEYKYKFLLNNLIVSLLRTVRRLEHRIHVAHS